MIKKSEKTSSTSLITIVSLVVYFDYIYLLVIHKKFLPSFSGLLFALIPVILINIIWNSKSKKI